MPSEFSCFISVFSWRLSCYQKHHSDITFLLERATWKVAFGFISIPSLSASFLLQQSSNYQGNAKQFNFNFTHFIYIYIEKTHIIFISLKTCWKLKNEYKFQLHWRLENYLFLQGSISTIRTIEFRINIRIGFLQSQIGVTIS